MTLLAGVVLLVRFKEPTHHDVTTPVLDRLKTALRQVTRVPAIRWNFLGWFMVYAGIGAMDPFVPVLIDRLAGGVDSATLIGGLLGAYGMLLALTTPIAGRFSDRVGSERLF